MKNLFLMLLSALGFCTACSASDGSKVEVLEPKVFIEMANSDTTAVILDVRRPDEFAAGHIPNAVNIPNESIGADEIDELPDKDRLILVYCRSGNRSKQASEKLVRLGYTNIVEFGGILDWKGEIEK